MIKHRYVAGVGLLFGLTLTAFSQNTGTDAVTWSSQATLIKSDNDERLYRLQFEGRIAPGYIVYGSDFAAGLGPNPTRLRFATDSGITPQGALESAGTHKGADAAFKIDYTYFKGEAKLSQVVAIAADKQRIVGTIRGQTCYETEGTCQLFNTKFDVAIP